MTYWVVSDDAVMNMPCVCTASGLQLSISPRGTQIKTVDSGIIFTCVVVVDDSTAITEDSSAAAELPTAADMRWVGPDLQYVSSAKGARYAAKRLLYLLCYLSY